MTSQNAVTWIDVLSALLTPTIALIALYIAFQQWRTNRNKLKLELFERRYAFYESARTLLAAILTAGRATRQTTFEFLVATKGAQFVVGEEIASYFDKELYSKAVDLETWESELKGNLSQADRGRLIELQSQTKKWFADQYTVLDEKFKPLLQLTH